MAILATTGSKFSRDNTGIRKVSLVFSIPGPTQDGGPEPWTELDRFMPTDVPAGLEYYDRDADKQEDGSWKLTIVFQGAGENDQLTEDVELDDSSSEDPIESFEDFDALTKKYPAIFDAETQKFTGWKRKWKDPTSGNLVRNPIYGTSHFLTGNVVLRVTFNARRIDMSLLQNMRKIDRPRLPEKAAKLRETPDGMQWLKRSVRMSMKGNVWQFTVEYLLGSWVPDIYQPKKAAR